MKNIVLSFIVVCLISCGKDKIIKLPEISHAEISEIKDVSAAYLFYNETKRDSIELNRRNLISTTNWLINVDKRLSLKQAIPKIQFLQKKKRNSSHKNEQAKNYFTCHNISSNTLGFIEFTDVVYMNKTTENLIADKSTDKSIILYFNSPNEIKINIPNEDASLTIKHVTFSKLTNDLIAIIEKQENKTSFVLSFNHNLSFQEYISFKSELLKLSHQPIFISNNEFISN